MDDAIRRLTIDLGGADADRLLRHWRWLVGPGLRPVFATLLGDLFLASSDGQVWWLDVGVAELTAVAADAEEFARQMDDPEQVDLWFGPRLVEALRAEGRRLTDGECYSYEQLPILGGEFEPANFRPRDLQTHLDVWGPIQEKIKDLPDGSTIEFVVGE
jgi:hypothetical protein